MATDPMSPIAGVSLATYAELAVAMAETGDDVAKQTAIAAEHGVDEASWNAARDGWTARMQDPANQGKVAHAFVPLYQAAQAARRGGAAPATLEQYTLVVAAYSFEKDAHGNQLPVADALARFGFTAPQWNEITGYWTPKVNDPADPAASEFRTRMQAESDRIFGIVRTPSPAPAEVEAPPPRKPAPARADGPKGEEGLVGAVLGWVRSMMS